MITLFLLVSSLSLGQETGATSSVPRLISYSGIAKNGNGKPLTGPLGVTFALYKEEEGGAPIWLEAQSVQADATGHYTATPVQWFAPGSIQQLRSSMVGRAGRRTLEQNEKLRSSVALVANKHISGSPQH